MDKMSQAKNSNERLICISELAQYNQFYVGWQEKPVY